MRKNFDEFFEKNTFQLGIVYGWQRLIPDEMISQFPQGLFGFHASPERLPRGRGRSPLNWGMILGKTALYNHCFKYNSHADAGDIYSITAFEITQHDTILTLLYKSLLIAKKEIVRLIDDVNKGTLTLSPQKGEPSFFEKRTEEDGLIDFKTGITADIINLIRGVTTPFHGAYCFKENAQKIVIFEAWAFDHVMDFSKYKPGQVIDNIYNLPVVKTTDGSIIIKKYEGEVLMPNEQLISQNKRLPSSSSGITLIEVMLIAMLLAILSAIIFRVYSDKSEHHKLTPAEVTILTIKNAMMFYKLDNGVYPTDEQGISALVIKPTTKPIPLHWSNYLKTIPRDEEGHPYFYPSSY